MATLGEAYIEVHADTSPFAKELKREVDALLKKLDTTLAAEGEKTGKKFGAGVGKGLNEEGDKVVLTWRQRMRKAFSDIGSDAGDAFQQSFQRLATSNFILFRVIGNMSQRLGSLFTTVKKVGKEIFNLGSALLKANVAMLQLGFQGAKSLLGFSNNLASSLSAAQAAGSQLAGAFAALAASAAQGAIGLAAMAAAAALLASVLAVLVAVAVVALAPFSDLLGFALLIPGALAVILAVIFPLVIALHSLGDALELVFEKDPKKFAEGLKELSPVMRQLTLSLRSLLPLFTSIQNSVQKKFLGPILSILAPTIARIGPSLQKGLGTAAQSMGVFVAQIINLLNTPVFKRFVEELFPAVARMIDTLGPPVLRILTALASLATASLPTIERLVTSLGGFIDRFAKWIEDSVADGSFQTFLDEALLSLDAIWGLVDSLITLFSELFDETDEGGRSFLKKITEAVNEFTKWLKSPEGKRALQDAVVLALAFAEAFKIALAFVRLVVGVLSTAIRKAMALLDLLGIIDLAPGGKVLGKAGSFSGGGVVGYDQVAMVHKGEPILDPANSDRRNRSILAEAGMLDLLEGGTSVAISIDGRVLRETVDYTVQRNDRANAQAITYGSRRT